MEKIESFNLHNLRNNEHFQFMTDLNVLIVKHQATELRIDNLYPGFLSLLSEEETAMRVETGSIKTQLITEYDQNRDNTWSALSAKVEANLKSPIEREVAAAEELIRVFNLYGNVAVLSYNEESAALSNLVNDLLKPEHETAVSTLGISAWINELKSQNEQFQALFNERNTELAIRDSGNVKAVRQKIDMLYEQIVVRINASIVMELAARATNDFVTDLNERISYYKTTLAIRISNSKSNSAEVSE